MKEISVNQEISLSSCESQHSQNVVRHFEKGRKRYCKSEMLPSFIEHSEAFK
ncbi:MAG: hypothetical protein IKN64_12845 [Desulfovibrio sp.]|nr:hypothetical protein [Desulfovibrio sp.]